ncbi:MAG TPA: ATP-binding protein [Methylomirabilota bacterium]|jgi:signal transduction histidine kinase|nr:ATP-binding protein [Methylomirabilota bacterium]
MIYRVFYFAGAAVARLVARLPDNYHRVTLGEASDAVDTPAVVLVDAVIDQLERALALKRRHAALEIVVLGDASSLPATPSEHVYAYLVNTLPAAIIAQALANAFLHAQLRAEQERTKAHLERLTTESQKLNAIGIALSAERDRAALLGLVLSKAREITHADAGSLYLVEEDSEGSRQLRFIVVQNDSFPAPFEGSTLPVDSQSVAGHVALTGEVLNLQDAYAALPGAPFEIDRKYDGQTSYRTKSMLVVPMKTPDGHTIGVLQLINCKLDPGRRLGSREEIEREARPFPARFEDLACSVASQAAVALENSRLYAELRAALAKVEASQRRIVQVERLRALGEMAGGLAHDFNNTLAVVLGRAQLLLNQTDDPEIRRQLRVIEEAATEGARTIRRIMEFARKRRDRPFQSVELNQLIREVVELTRPRWKDDAEARGIAYEVRVETTPVLPVAGDPYELREALTNVVLNALDAMPRGGLIMLATSGEGDHVRCVVTDTGVGMTEEVRHRVFEPFFTTKGEKGSGLGLSVMYGIIVRHGGEVDVESRPGHGSAFTIRLPVAREPVAPPAPPAPAPPRPGARVLVIDDEPHVRAIIMETLTRDGYQVIACGDGREGISRFDAETFDVVVTDLGMPGLTGWDVAQHVKRQRPRTPVVLVTGWGDRLSAEEIQTRGVDFLVSKPFALDQVRAVVRRALVPR